jgi:phosphohistidine phosphatase
MGRVKLYLVQHGEAAAKEDEPDRPLTARGTRQVERMADFLQDGSVAADLVEHSGKKRAEQTADILAPYVGDDARLRKRDGIAPNDAVGPVAQEMNGSEEDRMLVGHMPFMAKLATLLVTGKEEPSIVRFEPGTVLCLERGDTWTVSWLVTPSLLGS